MSKINCLSLYLYLYFAHHDEDVLPLFVFVSHSPCQKCIASPDFFFDAFHDLLPASCPDSSAAPSESRDFVWFITQVCPATSYNQLGPTQHHMPSEICKIPSMKVILIFVHPDHIFKVGKFVFHFDTENWEEQLKKHPVKIFKHCRNYWACENLICIGNREVKTSTLSCIIRVHAEYSTIQVLAEYALTWMILEYSQVLSTQTSTRYPKNERVYSF